MTAAAARPDSDRNLVVAVIGNPNTGKSTLFNALTGLRQKVANYPGVTVEKHTGRCRIGGDTVQLVDLPGAYSLSAHSLEELITVDVLTGVRDLKPDAVLVVLDAGNLSRNLFLLSQVLELGLPVVVALNLSDLAERRGIVVDADELSRRLDTPVITTVASTGAGVAPLRLALATALLGERKTRGCLLPKISAAAGDLCIELAEAGRTHSRVEIERALIDVGGAAEDRLIRHADPTTRSRLTELRTRLADGRSLAALEAERRYRWAVEILDGVEDRIIKRSWSDQIDRVVHHPIAGVALFLGVMAAVFQAVFAWATPVMDLIDDTAGGFRALVAAFLPEGALASLLSDGLIAGVGGVLVFLPQIVILFAFVAVLEDCGYMARAAVLMDRVMKACGLSGHSFIPMLSSFACAVPGIMACRVIRDPRDRIATMLAAPFMTCSARLPVYALLIAAFVPRRSYLGGVINLQGVVLLGLYLLGIAGGIVTALLLKRTFLRGPAPPFLMELPPFRRPAWRSVLVQVANRGRAFVVRAGTVICAASLVVWALAYFPRSQQISDRFEAERATARSAQNDSALAGRLSEIDRLEGAAHLENSLLGRTGRLVEPVFAPLGWDWRVSAAVLASFPAREVVIAVLGTTYAMGGDDDHTGLGDGLRAAAWPDGRPVFTLATALGLMVFFAFCLQCFATMAVMRRETGSWRWPAAAWLYMTAAAYLGAWVTVTVAGWVSA